MWGAIGQGDPISPLFHEGAQDVQLINLSILPLGGWLVFRLRKRSWSGAARFGGRLWGGGGMVAQIEVREMRRKRYKSPSLVLDRRSFADRSGFAPSVRRQTGRSFCLRGTCWRTSRMSSGVRVLWLGVASVWFPVEWCFPSCQNCLIKRTHWAHPVWTR
jgi:hypothetical protein